MVDAEAGAKVERAASAVGLSSEQLVNLIADSGLMAAPPSDGITEVMSLQDLGKRLHTLAVGHPIAARQKWFGGLLPTQKKALLTVLRERGYATAVIAQEYGVDPLEVVEAHNQFADKLGKNVINIRMSTIAGNMQLAAERAQQGAMETGDWSTYWRIQKELTMLQQSLGIADRAAQKVEIDNRISIGFEEKEEEIKKIVAMAERGTQRRLEIDLAKEEDHDLAILSETTSGNRASEKEARIVVEGCSSPKQGQPSSDGEGQQAPRDDPGTPG